MSSDLEGDLNQDGIIDEMDRVRGDLGGGINQLGEQVRNMFNWQAYVRSAPLTSAAAALVLGYLLAPRLRSAPVVQAPPANFDQSTNSPTSSRGGIGSLLSNIVWGSLAQAGSVYVAELLTNQLSGGAATSTEHKSPFDSAESNFDLGDEL